MKNLYSLLLGLVLAVTLCACGTGIESEGEASIYMLAAGGHLGPVREAIEDGFDVNAPDPEGRTLLHYTVAGNQPALFEYLIVQYRANVNATDSEGKTVVDYVRASNNPQMMQVLDDEGLL